MCIVYIDHQLNAHRRVHVCACVYKHFKRKDNMHICMYALYTHELAIKLAIMSNRCQIKTNETNQLIFKMNEEENCN